MTDPSLGRSVANFVLALLNATLILAALCLWLAWGAFSTAERVSEKLGAAAKTVAPLRADVSALAVEIAATRAELAAQRADDALAARIAGLEAQLTELTAAVTSLDADPDALIERAVRSVFDGLGDTVVDILSAFRGTRVSEEE